MYGRTRFCVPYAPSRWFEISIEDWEKNCQEEYGKRPEKGTSALFVYEKGFFWYTGWHKLLFKVNMLKSILYEGEKESVTADSDRR